MWYQPGPNLATTALGLGLYSPLSGWYIGYIKAIFYLLKGDYKVVGFRALLAVLVYKCLHVPCWTTNSSLSIKCNVVSCLCFSNDNQNQFQVQQMQTLERCFLWFSPEPRFSGELAQRVQSTYMVQSMVSVVVTSLRVWVSIPYIGT